MHTSCMYVGMKVIPNGRNRKLDSTTAHYHYNHGMMSSLYRALRVGVSFQLPLYPKLEIKLESKSNIINITSLLTRQLGEDRNAWVRGYDIIVHFTTSTHCWIDLNEFEDQHYDIRQEICCLSLLSNNRSTSWEWC